MLSCTKNQPTETPEVYPHLLELISPIGNAVYNDGDTVLIGWKPANVENLLISRKRTNVWEPIVHQIDARIITEYRYPIPIGEGTDFWIKICDNLDPAVFDITDSALTIIKKEILLLEPVSGNAYLADRDLNIRWNYTSLKNEKVRISISFDDGISWEIVGDNINANVGDFVFKNSLEKTSLQCRIKIEDIYNSNYITISEKPFIIYLTIPIDYNYLMLQPGNVWNWQQVYQSIDNTKPDTSYFKAEIIREVIISDSLDSFEVRMIDDQNKIDYGNYTVDKINGVASLVQGEVHLTYPVGYFIVDESSNPEYNTTLTVLENSTELFGKPVKTRRLSYHLWISNWHTILGENFGCIQFGGSDDFNHSYAILKGCVINGIVYGDTTLIINDK